MGDRELALGIRQALCLALDFLEKWLIARGWWDKTPTAKLRKFDKSGNDGIIR